MRRNRSEEKRLGRRRRWILGRLRREEGDRKNRRKMGEEGREWDGKE